MYTLCLLNINCLDVVLARNVLNYAVAISSHLFLCL